MKDEEIYTNILQQPGIDIIEGVEIPTENFSAEEVEFNHEGLTGHGEIALKQRALCIDLNFSVADGNWDLHFLRMNQEETATISGLKSGKLQVAYADSKIVEITVDDSDVSVCLTRVNDYPLFHIKK